MSLIPLLEVTGEEHRFLMAEFLGTNHKGTTATVLAFYKFCDFEFLAVPVTLAEIPNQFSFSVKKAVRRGINITIF